MVLLPNPKHIIGMQLLWKSIGHFKMRLLDSLLEAKNHIVLQRSKEPVLEEESSSQTQLLHSILFFESGQEEPIDT